MNNRHSLWLLGLFSAFAMLNSTVAHAEAADRDKPIEIEADTVTVNDAKKIDIYTGNVILTQGTLVIKGDKLTVHEDIDGFQHSTSLGNPTTFKQKRDGVNEYIEGSGLRIEYDARMDKVQLYTKASVKRGDDVAYGDYISYDANAGYAEVLSGPTAPLGGKPGRVKAIIQPKNKTEPSKTEVKPETKAAPAIINKNLRFSNKLELDTDPLSTKE